MEALIEHVGGTRWTVRWWVNGVLAGGHPDVRNVDMPIVQHQLAPTWGGAAEVEKPQDEWLRFDHVYLGR